MVVIIIVSFLSFSNFAKAQERNHIKQQLELIDAGTPPLLDPVREVRLPEPTPPSIGLFKKFTNILTASFSEKVTNQTANILSSVTGFFSNLFTDKSSSSETIIPIKQSDSSSRDEATIENNEETSSSSSEESVEHSVINTNTQSSPSDPSSPAGKPTSSASRLQPKTYNLSSSVTRKEVETLIQQSDDRNLALIRSVLVAPNPLTNSDSLSVQQSLANLSRRISLIQENNTRQLDHTYNSISRSFDDITSLDSVTMTNSSFSGTTGTFTGNATIGGTLDVSGATTLASLSVTSTTATSTFAGDIGFGSTSKWFQGGERFLTSSTTSAGNLTIGYQSASNLDANGGLYNTGVGYQALGNATSTTRNTAVGYQALLGSGIVSNVGSSTAVGYQALFSNTTGTDNTAYGVSSLYSNTTGKNNVASGIRSLHNNTTGSSNTAYGNYSLNSNISATNTTAVGYGAANGPSSYYNKGGVYLGYNAGYSAGNNSDYNTLLGYQAGYGVTTGSNNIWLGSATSSTAIANLTTGSQNILIGNNISLPSATASGQLNIGNLIYGTGITSTGSTLSSGNIGIGTTSPYAKLSVVGPVVAEYFHATSTTATSTFASSLVVDESTFVVDSYNNYVGIGTTSPTSQLHIVSSWAGSVMTESTQADGYPYYGLINGSPSSGSGRWEIQMNGTSYNGTDSDNALTFKNKTNGVSTVRMLIQPSGNIGIGTTSPYAKLSVVGPVVAEYFHATSTTATSTFAGFIDVLGTGANATSTFSGNLWVKSTLRAAVSYVGDLIFANNFRFTEADPILTGSNALYLQNQFGSTTLAVDENGNIGIGTTSPAYKLQVMGDIAATSFVNTSTRDAKKDINYLTSSQESDFLNKIKNTNIANYHYSIENQANPLRLGLIAEEAPSEILSVDGKGVDVYKMATFTLGGVKALQKEIEKMKIDITALSAGAGGAISGSDSLFSWITDKFKTALGIGFEQGKICLEDVCVNKTQLKELLEKNNISSASSSSESSSSSSSSEASSESSSSSSSSESSSENSSSSEAASSSSQASSESSSSSSSSSSESSSSSSTEASSSSSSESLNSSQSSNSSDAISSSSSSEEALSSSSSSL